MFRNIRTLSFILFGVLFFLTIGIFLSRNLSNILSYPNNNIRKVTINNHLLKVETADTDDKRAQGLSNRISLKDNNGMLFMFEKPGFYYFWMKDMKFPLDFIWIDKDIVVDVSENVSAPKSNAEKLTTFTARKPFDNVLEVNAGIVKSLNIVIGDVIH